MAGVQNGLHRGHLFAALLGRAAGHHRLLIPGQAPGDLRQRLGLVLVGHQGRKGIGEHGQPPRIEVATG